MGFAVGGKAIGGIRLGLDLHARGAVRMERATDAAVGVNPELVMLQDGFHTQTGLDLGDFHTKNYICDYLERSKDKIKFL